jgi:5'(3')-deoxyribonucleotidase
MGQCIISKERRQEIKAKMKRKTADQGREVITELREVIRDLHSQSVDMEKKALLMRMNDGNEEDIVQYLTTSTELIYEANKMRRLLRNLETKNRALSHVDLTQKIASYYKGSIADASVVEAQTKGLEDTMDNFAEFVDTISETTELLSYTTNVDVTDKVDLLAKLDASIRKNSLCPLKEQQLTRTDTSQIYTTNESDTTNEFDTTNELDTTNEFDNLSKLLDYSSISLN